MSSLAYQTIPYRYSPLLLSSSSALDAYDNFDTLTRSMRDLTTYADFISRALAADQAQQSDGKTSDTKTNGSRDPKTPRARALGLSLRPRIDWRETADGFVLTAATPGLRKDQLRVELLDAADQCYIEVAGGTAGKPDSNSEDGAQADKPKEAAKPPELRPTYGAFSERVLLPAGMDREAMRATYEDGLLVVSVPRKKADDVKRQKLAIG